MQSCLRNQVFQIYPGSCAKKFLQSAFTIPELIATLGILAVLIVMGVGAYRANISRFETPRCLANLRNLHVALSAHIQEQQQWPQLPPEIADINTPAEYDWWIEKLLPYGMEKRNWLCPTLTRLVKDKGNSIEAPKIHYMPSIFDENALTPFKWANMPWAMETADVHGGGILRLYSDGSIRPFTDFQNLLQRSPVQEN